MIAIISPAMNMVNNSDSQYKVSAPAFQASADELAAIIKTYSHFELEGLLKTNEKIAFRAFQYYQDYPLQKAILPALFAFNGLAYQTIAPQDFT